MDGQILRWGLAGAWRVRELPAMGTQSCLPPGSSTPSLEPVLQSSAFQLSPTSPIFQGDNGQGSWAHL